MSALPKAIREQVDAAEEIHGKVYNPKPKDKPEGDPKPEASNEEPEKAGHETPQETPTQAEELNQEPEEPAKAAVPTEEPQEPAEPAEPKGEAPDAWQRRYEILKGKYDAEVPRMAAQIREMKGEMDGLRGLLANLQQTPPGASQATPQAPASLIDPKEREEYGDELISVIQRGAQEVFNPEVAGLREEIAELKRQLGGMGQTLTQTQQGTVLDRLAQEVPEWEKLNNDELFLDWLAQEDRYAGMTRQDMLDRAFKANDAARVIRFFKGYLEENAALQPAQADPAPAPARKTETTLDDMVAPGKPSGASGQVAQTGNKRTWTQKQIADFYRKVNAGKYRTRPKEQEEIERDIVAAAGEGRITA